MRAGKLEKWLLLEQSGELSARRSERLHRELAASEKARALRDELGLLKASIITPDIESAPWAAVRIAARLRGENTPVLNLSRVLKPVLALAACLLLTTSLFNFHGNQTYSSPAAVMVAGVDVWRDPLEKYLVKFESLMVAISGNTLDIMEM